MACHEAHVVAQAVPEDGISQIAPSLVQILDGISLMAAIKARCFAAL